MDIKKIIKKVIKSMDFNTEIKLEKNTILVEINGAEENSEYAFYLYWYPDQHTDKKAVVEQGYTKSNKMTFQVDKSGYYLVRCFAQKNLKRSDQYTDTVLYINDELVNEFNKQMKKDLRTSRTINEPIKYSKVPYPQNDFCLISQKNGSNNITDNLKKWCKENKFEISELTQYKGWNTKNLLIYDSTNKVQSGLKDNYIFSGYMWNDDKFYFGQEDIPKAINMHTLYENLGMYSLVALESDRIKITEDFYAYGGLYYYECDDLFVVANVYHLLLMVLGNLKCKYELDYDQLYTMFASNVTLFRQPFTSELLIKNTYYVNMCDEIIVDKKGWKIVKRPSFNILNGPCDFIEEQYNALIDGAKNRIISNVEAAINNPRFKEFVLELSGGKDSRTTFAALTNIKDAEKKVKILSTDHEPHDLDVAVGLVNMFGYEFSTYSNNFYIDDILENIRRKRSYSCGIRWLWYIEHRHEYDLSRLVLNGDSFESFCVRYYSKTVLSRTGTNPTEEKLLEVYSKMLSRQAIGDYSKVENIVTENIRKGMNQIPGSTPMEKFDNMLMFYRGRIHGGTMDRMYYSCAMANPLQAKELLLAKKMWINNFEDEKIIFDINYTLNPVLAMLPYNAKRYNETREKVKDTIRYDDIRFKNFKGILDTNRTKWEEAEKIKAKNVKINYSTNYIDRGKEIDIVFENCMLGIQKLNNLFEEKIKDDICLPLYYYVHAEKSDDVEVRVIHNKINSVIDCIDAIGREKVFL